MTLDLANYPNLAKANIPEELRKQPKESLTKIANELRRYLLDSVSQSSGHFASGLGTVELTVALHYVYNCRYYIRKMLQTFFHLFSRNSFKNNRQKSSASSQKSPPANDVSKHLCELIFI